MKMINTDLMWNNMFGIFKSKNKEQTVNTTEKLDNLLNTLNGWKPSVIYLGSYYWKGLPKHLKYDYNLLNIERSGRFAKIPMKEETFYRNVLLILDKEDEYTFDVGNSQKI